MYQDFSVPKYLVAIDTGVRKTLGVCFLEFHVKGIAFQYATRLKKSFLRTSDGKKKIARDLFISADEKVSIFLLYYKVFDFSEDKRVKTIQELDSLVERFFGDKDEKPVFVIEDFLFFRVSDKKAKFYGIRPATWFTVSKMQKAIGFMQGYFMAKGYDVNIMPPRTWKSYVDPFYMILAGKYLKNLTNESGKVVFKLRKTEIDHLSSAFGLGLAFFTEAFISSAFQKQKKGTSQH